VNKRSKTLFARAQKLIPGGVNSPVRAFRSVGGNPRFIKAGKGSRVVDVDGNSYIDYLGSWGPLILGHCPAPVRAALKNQISLGTSFGATTENEVVLAEMLTEAVPSIEKVRLVNSGTEATMSAVRLARAFTNRNKIIKFDGCYHGHSDSVLVGAGSGLLTGGTLHSLGISRHVASDTYVAPFNDIEAVNAIIREKGAEIAAIIVERCPATWGSCRRSRSSSPNCGVRRIVAARC